VSINSHNTVCCCCGIWRRVSGSFEIRIPVRTKEVLLFREERLYSILKWIRETVPTKSRWWKVFDRYVSQIGGRVAGFGGEVFAVLGDGRRSGDHCACGERGSSMRLATTS